MDKILIIKLGALGDVLRTTPILRVLKGDVTWVTLPNALPLLARNPFIQETMTIQKARQKLKGKKFDLVLNLDEEENACLLAGSVKAGELAGVYHDRSGKNAYTAKASPWFDMSLISKFGKEKADKLKLKNRKTYQEMLFAMIGKKFKGEEYVLVPPAPKEELSKRDVGIEARSGERWMAKRWPHVPEFVRLLKKRGLSCMKFTQYPTLDEFILQTDRAETVVTTDSLALHIAMALKKKIVALFPCTSPWEICGYGRTENIISPLLSKYFYSTAKTLEPGRAISPRAVLDAYKKLNP